MTDIFQELRDQFSDADFLKLSDTSKYRIQAAADFAKGVIEHWEEMDDDKRAKRAKHLDAQAAGLRSIITSKTANTLDEIFWNAIRAAAGDNVFTAIKALI